MNAIKFIHCADLHIDTPFKGIGSIDQELKDILYNSTFKSFQNIVQIAIDNEVHAVIIAGDIYDGADKSLKAQLKFRDELLRLSEAGIQSFIVAGNHDPLDGWAASIEWPDLVHLFSGKKVEKIPLVIDGETIADIYGISFPTRDVTENLALQFKRENKDIPSIAILHTNIGENTGHKSYAPATIADLKSRGFDYWALGHVHTRKVLSKRDPTILYPGNTQARSAREPGSKGCSLVTLEKDGACEITHFPTDVVRYHKNIIDLSGIETLDDVIDKMKTECEDEAKTLEGRHLIIRLQLTGRCAVNQELRKGNSITDILESIREHFFGREQIIFLEKIQLATAGNYDLESLTGGNDFIADIISLYGEMDIKDASSLEEIKEMLKSLTVNWAGSKHMDEFSDEDIVSFAAEARDWTLDQIVGED
ncbi:MAG: DNA repair exonuclease [Calditrichaeota bacterium]|nr:DNA repair exonuclease [Calditrichota bacterium]